MYKFNIEFGDISQDGHERTAVFSIECSVDQHKLEKLFNNACINTNFDFKEELCDEYVFTFDKKYYKVNTRTIDGSIHGEIDNIPWIDHNLEDFEVYPKTITQTIYVSKND